MKKLMKEFANPSSKYRPSPLWVWNDRMTKEQIDFQLEELASHGFGGAFAHPRPGMVTEYMSDEWFELWSYALNKAQELGIALNIYDENSYPSGFAGGRVTGNHPEALATIMRYQITDSVGELPEELIAIYSVVKKDGVLSEANNLTDVPQEEWKTEGKYILISKENPPTHGYMAGFCYVDLLRPHIHDAFMESTYDKYYEKYGEHFGKSIQAIFTDEPTAGVAKGVDNILPFSYWFAHEFKKKNGYDLVKHLACVFVNITGDCFEYPASKVRFDYYNTIHYLFTKNHIEPSGRWCEEHGINWTGHYFEHMWPHVAEETTPASQSYYEYHQWPAIDMLFSDYLKERPTHIVEHTIRELKSASNQFAKERAVCELYGAGGWDSTFEDYKRMADWVMVNGVNFISQHLIYSTIMGARKCDHPQSFDWRQPWWNEYTRMNDYVSRLSFMLSQGKMEQRILVLNPTTTGYLTEAKKYSGDMIREGELDAIKEPNMTEFLTLCQKLTELQWDYDLGDEYTLARHGKAENGKLSVEKQQYSCVVISENMKNMLSSTKMLLEACMNNGVKVLVVGKPGCYIDGMYDEESYSILANKWEEVSIDSVNERLKQLLVPRITSSVPFPIGLNHMRRKLEDGSEVWFFTNHAMETYHAEIFLEGKSVKQLDLFTGEMKDIFYGETDGKLCIPVELVRNQSLLLVVSEEKGNSKAEPENEAETVITLTDCEITREQENVYPILYADYNEYKDRHTKFLCDRIYQERGFGSDPWNFKVQFKQNILDRNVDYDEESGFNVAYRFVIEEGYIPTNLAAVAEHPELCHLRVNGKLVEWNPGETYLDHHFGVASISDCVHCGENIIEVVVDVFHTLMELEPIYLKGDFSVVEKEEKWLITKPLPLAYGSWKVQGLPFYPYAVQYKYRFTLDKAPKSAKIDLSEYNTTATSLVVNGQEAGLLHVDGRRALDVTPLVKEGENEIIVRVSGSFKNLLGPHFCDARGSAWPVMWKQAPLHTPSADKFDLMDWGMNSEPILIVE